MLPGVIKVCMTVCQSSSSPSSSLSSLSANREGEDTGHVTFNPDSTWFISLRKPKCYSGRMSETWTCIFSYNWISDRKKKVRRQWSFQSSLWLLPWRKWPILFAWLSINFFSFIALEYLVKFAWPQKANNINGMHKRGTDNKRLILKAQSTMKKWDRHRERQLQNASPLKFVHGL